MDGLLARLRAMLGSKRARPRMPSLDPKPENDPWGQRLVGLIAILIGIGVLAELVLYVMIEGIPSWGIAIAVGGLVAVALLAVRFGYRLLANRPNPYGSIMGPAAWRACGMVLLIGTTAMSIWLIKQGTVPWRLLWLLILAAACVGKAEHMVRSGANIQERRIRFKD